MKNIWRKIVALICVLTLCVGTINVTTMAVDSYAGKLTIKNSLATSKNSTNFYIKGTDSYTIGSEWSDSTMMPASDDATSGVFVDGERIENYYSAHEGSNTNVRLRKINDAGHYYIENIPDVVTGSVVTIKGTFFVYGGWLQTDVFDSTPIVIEESNFQWNGSQWIDCYAGKLAIKDSLAPSSNSTNFYIKGTDSYTIGSEWSDSTMMPASDDATSGIFVDGERIENYYSAHEGSNTNVRLRKINDNGEHYYIENIPNVANGSVVTIKGTFYVYGGWLQTDVYDSTPIVIEESNFQWNGSQWVDYVEPKAYNGKLSVEGAQIPTTKIGCIYLKGTDTYLSEKNVEDWDSSEAKLQAKTTDANSGIFVNNVKQPNGLLKKYLGTNNWYFAEGFTATSTGDVVSVKGTFYSQDGLAKVTFEESKFQWNGSAWVDYVEIISYQGILSYVDGANASNSTSVYLETTDNMSLDSWDHAFYGMDKNKGESAENGIWLDGKYQSGAHMKKVGGRYYVGGFETANANSILKIAGTFICDTYNAKVTFEEAQFQWNGSAWGNYVEVKNYQGTLSILADKSNNNQHLYLSTTDEHTAENTGIVIWESKFYAKDVNSGVYVNGKRKADAFMKRTNTYAYYLEEIGTLNAGDKVTIEGTFFVEGNGNTVTFEEFNILWDGNCWLDCSEIKNYAEGTFWLDTNSPNTATSLYLRGSVDIHEDCSPSDNPDFGWETPVGTTGFYKNGEACVGTMKNVANGGGWYLGLESAGIAVGDKLTIRGTFGYNGRYVKVTEYNLWFTNDGWKITAPITTDTQIYGDSNGDGELNSLDIARLIKHLNNQPVSIYKEDASGNDTGADANGVDGVNDRDRIKIYEYILEGAKRTVDGSYTVEYYPVYLDDEDIELGAYQGPRGAGKNDYTYSNDSLSSSVVNTNFLNTTEFTKYKEAGFNILLHETDGPYNSATTGIGYGFEDGNLVNYLRLAKETGLGVYITSLGLNSYIKGSTSINFNGDSDLLDTVTINEKVLGWDYNGDGTFSEAATMTEIFSYSDSITSYSLDSKVNPGSKMTIVEADIVELFDYIVENGYKDIFRGISMVDEPTIAGQENYIKAVELIDKLAEIYGLDVQYQGCVFPTYVADNQTNIGNDYASYINGFGKVAGSLMYDFYPLLNTRKAMSSSWTNTLHSSWLTDLQTVATQGKANKYITGITLQSCGYEFAGNSSWWYNENYRRNPQTDADMQFQVYSALAFGMKKINYFTYWEHETQSSSGEWFTGSMVEYPAAGGTESVKTDIYTYVQNANKEITKFDHVFMDYDWVETKTVGSSSLFSGVTSANISGVTVNSSSNASIISHMYDSEKQLDGYWLVNMAEPSTSTKATLNVTFAGKNKAMVYINGEEKIVDLTNGVYEADLAVGEGIFIIPLNIQ